MSEEVLQNASEVIDALGGTSAVARLTRRRPQAVSNWRGTNRIPPDTVLVMRAALEEKGLRSDLALWGIQEPA